MGRSGAFDCVNNDERPAGGGSTSSHARRSGHACQGPRGSSNRWQDGEEPVRRLSPNASITNQHHGAVGPLVVVLTVQSDGG
jgi:hypothetical protein